MRVTISVYSPLPSNFRFILWRPGGWEVMIDFHCDRREEGEEEGEDVSMEKEGLQLLLDQANFQAREQRQL